ncbi:MAG: hypothetical protein HY650_05080 [Acidobacteria bacterium]|nr:hypothetical protein [Acidobacteriota bacterium]
MRQSLVGKVLVAAVVAALIAPVGLLGQTGSSAEPTRDDERHVLRALLDEIHQLRLALQRANVVSYRLHITLERIRLQQARVDSISRDLESVRARLADLKTARTQMEEQVKSLESLLISTADANRRAELGQQIQEMKGRVSIWTRDEEQLRVRETELISASQIEEAKLDELHNQLDRMAREWGAS